MDAPTKTQNAFKNRTDVQPMTVGRLKKLLESWSDDAIVSTEEIDDIAYVVTDVAREGNDLTLLVVSEYAACIEDALTPKYP